MFRYKNTNVFVLILVLLVGLVLGGFLGELILLLTTKFPSLEVLNILRYGKSFSLANPIGFDLDLLAISFTFKIKITVCGILGMLLSYIVFRKIT